MVVNRAQLRGVGDALRQAGRDMVRMQPAPADERKLQGTIANIPQSQITAAKRRGDFAEFRRLTQAKTKAQMQLREKVSARNKPIAKEAAINMIPLSWTRNWNAMNPQERAANLLIDIVTVGIPLARPAAGGARVIGSVTKNTAVGSAKVLNSGLKKVNTKMKTGRPRDVKKAGELLEMLSKQVEPSAKRAFEKRGQFLKDNANDVSIIVKNSQGKKPVFKMPDDLSKLATKTEPKTSKKTKTAVAEVNPVKVKKLQEAFKVLNREAFDALSKTKPKSKSLTIRKKAQPPAAKPKPKAPKKSKISKRAVAAAAGAVAKIATARKPKPKLEGDPAGEGEGKPKGEGEGKPKGEGEGKPKGEGEGKPKGEGEGKPKGEGEGKPKGEGEGKPKGEGEGKPKGEDETDPTTTDEADPRDEPKQDPRDEPKQDPRDEPKQDPRDEPKQDPRDEPKQDPKDDPKQDPKDDPKQDPDTTPTDKTTTRTRPTPRTSTTRPKTNRKPKFDLPNKNTDARIMAGKYPDKITFVDGFTRWFVDLSSGKSRAIRATKSGKPRQTFKVLTASSRKPDARRIPLGVVAMVISDDGVRFRRRRQGATRVFKKRK